MGWMQLEEGDFGRVPGQKVLEKEREAEETAAAPERAGTTAEYVVYVVCINCGKLRPMGDEVCECGTLLYEKMRKLAG